MPKYILTKIKEYDANGGPTVPSIGADKREQTSTRAGRYVIETIGKHVSAHKYGQWSGVAWGTEMRLIGDITMVKKNGVWIKLTDVNEKWGAFKNYQKIASDAIKSEYVKLYQDHSFPKRWVFNDFGHVSIKYFKDNNHNWRMDGKEQLMTDFIHTTPPDEANTVRHIPVSLQSSHGCIHVKPLDIDTLIGNGYARKGNSLEVHTYHEKTISATLTRAIARLPYEIHFYPGVFKIVVYQVRKMN